jgi:threonine dehydrogenase-like Zn-dependent dehydrogenase
MKLQEIIELGRRGIYKERDIVSVPFNVACGRCQNYKTV